MNGPLLIRAEQIGLIGLLKHKKNTKLGGGNSDYAGSGERMGMNGNTLYMCRKFSTERLNSIL